MIVLKSVAELSQWRRDLSIGAVVVLVPTMGALHAGHLELVRIAVAIPDATVVVSIFVNPGQFGPTEDFWKYPRTLESDLSMLKGAGVDAVFTPTERDLYPLGYGVATRVRVPRIGKRLCGKSRPMFFEGVCSVVLRLLNGVSPTQLILGEKDFQQVQVIRVMCRDLFIPVIITSVPTVREGDGLAMSSRNRYLSVSDRETARQLYKALSVAMGTVWNGERTAQIIEAGVLGHLSRYPSIRIDYVEVVDSTIRRQRLITESSRLVAAIWVGATRLIDNVALNLPFKES